MSLSKICSVSTLLSRSFVLLSRNFSTYHLTSVKKLAQQSAKQWLQKPVNKNVVKSGKLVGVLLSSAPLIRKASCKKSNISRRADKLREDKLSGPEPSLSWSDLWSLLKPYIGYFLAAVVCAILTAVVNIQLPIHLGALIDTMVQIIRDQAQGKSVDLFVINKDAINLVLCYGAQAVLTFMYISFITVLGERMAADLRIRLFDKLLHLDVAFHDHEKSGELSSRLNSDVQEFKSCFKMTISQGLKTFAQTAGCVVTLIRLSPQMTFMTLAALPIVIAVGTLCGAFLRSLSRNSQAQSAIAASVADEAFGNIRTVKAFAMEEKETEVFMLEVYKACYMNELLGYGIGIFQAGTNLFLNGIVLSVLYAGSGLIHSGKMTPGDLMSFLVTAQTIQKSLSQLSVIFGNALKGWTAGARVFQFINVVPTMRMDDGVCIPYHSLCGEVSFENVHFSYPTRKNHKVLEELNLTIPAGHIVALCGPSGEGKSTITALMERFYDPSSGRILLDGKDLRDLNLEWLRGRVIGLISQEPVLFHTTIEENIRYGRPDATDAEIQEAARLANAHNFIESFPDGYRTIVGERGTQLSGGQKQRIAIARALLKNPPILILDEATSALDTESEKLVKEALDVAMRNRTVLIIAHRLSTIQHANLIYVIKEKKVAEKGTHLELMKKKGEYYKLVESQSL